MSDTNSQQLVVFSIGTEEYALPIGTVHEIIRFTEPRSVASDVPWIRGVIGLRGKIIPIYDLAARIPELGRQDTEKLHRLFTKHAGRIFFATDFIYESRRGAARCCKFRQRTCSRLVTAPFVFHWADCSSKFAREALLVCPERVSGVFRRPDQSL